MDEKDLYIFLESKKFHLIESGKSDSFGDYCYVFANDVITLRFIKDKSMKAIDVQSIITNNNLWYDLALVKILLYDDTPLNDTMTNEQYNEFLKNEIDNIIALFDIPNCLLIEKKLEILSNERAKQMFPWLQ